MSRLLCLLALGSGHVYAQPRTPAKARFALSNIGAEEVPRLARRADPAVTRQLFAARPRLRQTAERPLMDVPRTPDAPQKRRIGVAPMSPWAGGSGIKVKIPF